MTVVPGRTSEDQVLQLLRRPAPPLGRLAAAGYQDRGRQAPFTENEFTVVAEDLADDGGIPGALSGRLDQSLADNATTNITLGAIADITAAFIDYHCIRSTDTEWGQIQVVLLQDGSTVEVFKDQHWPSGQSSCGLTISGDVSGGNLRLVITTSSTGSAADFRATFRTVVP